MLSCKKNKKSIYEILINAQGSKTKHKEQQLWYSHVYDYKTLFEGINIFLAIYF